MNAKKLDEARKKERYSFFNIEIIVAIGAIIFAILVSDKTIWERIGIVVFGSIPLISDIGSRVFDPHIYYAGEKIEKKK